MKTKFGFVEHLLWCFKFSYFLQFRLFFKLIERVHDIDEHYWTVKLRKLLTLLKITRKWKLEKNQKLDRSYRCIKGTPTVLWYHYLRVGCSSVVVDLEGCVSTLLVLMTTSTKFPNLLLGVPTCSPDILIYRQSCLWIHIKNRFFSIKRTKGLSRKFLFPFLFLLWLCFNGRGREW